MTLEEKPYPTGMDWQRKISTALGVKLGQENLTLAEAVEAIQALKRSVIMLEENS